MYQLAITKDENLVSFNAGNSPKMLRTHYMGFVMPDEVKKFKELTPEALIGQGQRPPLKLASPCARRPQDAL